MAPEIDDVSVQIGMRYQPLPNPLGLNPSMMSAAPSRDNRTSNRPCRARTIGTRSA